MGFFQLYSPQAQHLNRRCDATRMHVEGVLSDFKREIKDAKARFGTDLWTRAIHLLQIEPSRSAETPNSLRDLNDMIIFLLGSRFPPPPTLPRRRLYSK